MLLARGGLIRALYTPESSDMRRAERNLLRYHAAAMRRPNNSLNPTEVSKPFIEKLNGFGVVVGRVNSVVRLL